VCDTVTRFSIILLQPIISALSGRQKLTMIWTGMPVELHAIFPSGASSWFSGSSVARHRGAKYEPCASLYSCSLVDVTVRLLLYLFVMKRM
jgi:hypothetical protein